MSLATKSLSAIKSNYIGTVVRVAAQFGAQIAIMRELGPESIGIFGYALLMFGVLALVIDQGFGWSLVKADFKNKDEISIAFSRIMLAALLAGALVYSCSYPISTYLNNPLVGTIFRYSAPAYLLIGLFVVSQAQLRANLRFKEIQIATTGSYVIAYPLIGITLAACGFGVWALLVAWYVQAILQFAIAYHYSPHSLKLVNPFRRCASASLGRNVASINVLNWAVEGSGGLLVGGMGATQLGNFNAAAMLAKTPALQLVQVLQSILFSTASALGEDRRNIKRLYLSALAIIAFLVAPAYTYASMNAEMIIQLLFGEKWLHASGIFASLSIGMIALALSSISGAILTATGDQKITLLSQLICLATMLVGLSLTINIDLRYVGIAISLAYWGRFLIQLHAISKNNAIVFSDLVSALRGPTLLALIMGVPVPALEGHALPLLLVKCILISVMFILFPRFFFPPEITTVITRFTAGKKILRYLGL